MIILTNPMVARPIVFQEVKTMRQAVIGQKSRNCQRADFFSGNAESIDNAEKRRLYKIL